MNTMSRFAAISVAAASVSLLQIHGIEFWVEQAGRTGIVWSLVIEIAAIYLWLHKQTVPALLASALLVSGPLYQVASAALEQARKAEYTAVERVGAEQEVEQLESSLLRYERNSEKRVGWAGRIDATQERLDSARERLRELVVQQGEYQPSWHKSAIVSMEALALLVVLYAQVFALSRLRLTPKVSAENWKDEGGGRASENSGLERLSGDSKIEMPVENGTKDRVKEALFLVGERLPDFDGNRQLLAQHIGIRVADLSLLLHHEKRCRERKETISGRALDKIINNLRRGEVVSSAV